VTLLLQKGIHMFKVRRMFLKSLFYTFLSVGLNWLAVILIVPHMFLNSQSLWVQGTTNMLADIVTMLFFLPIFLFSHKVSIEEERWKNKN
jgi:hypothetical protein